MTSKLKCPVCQQDLGIILCDIDNFVCSKCRMCGSEKLWTALTQAKQDLEIARKALEDITKEHSVFADLVFKAVTMKSITEKALKQIEHKE